jgi:hypothetical protein
LRRPDLTSAKTNVISQRLEDEPRFDVELTGEDAAGKSLFSERREFDLIGVLTDFASFKRTGLCICAVPLDKIELNELSAVEIRFVGH